MMYYWIPPYRNGDSPLISIKAPYYNIDPLIDAVLPLKHLRNKCLSEEHFHNIVYYAQLCKMRGFCENTSQYVACAERYLAGKRKISPAGHRRKKTEARKRAQQRSNIPQEVVSLLEIAIKNSENMLDINKRTNYCVGQIMRSFKFDPVLIKELIVEKISV